MIGVGCCWLSLSAVAAVVCFDMVVVSLSPLASHYIEYLLMCLNHCVRWLDGAMNDCAMKTVSKFCRRFVVVVGEKNNDFLFVCKLHTAIERLHEPEQDRHSTNLRIGTKMTFVLLCAVPGWYVCLCAFSHCFG